MVSIIVDEKVRHGKPIIEGTRITVDEVMTMLETGMTYEEIEKEYGLKKKQILSAIRYTTSFVSGQEIHRISAA
ncbi:DUF433 domain-containing protein [Candidatus Woesearchaeota archaeon]|nr:DUF433 domain-containing protein [Candidatus Woesearchaeota archaeon]